MKRPILAVAVVSFTLTAPGVALAAQAPDPPLAQVLEQASREHKPVFLDFWTIWCGPCAMMDRDVFPKAEVQAALAGYVVQHYDAEIGEGAKLAEKFNVTQYPTLLVLSPDGQQIGRLIEQDPAALAKRLADIAPIAVASRAEAGDLATTHDARVLDLAAHEADDRGDYAAAIGFYQRAEAADAGNAALVANRASLRRLQLETYLAESRTHGEQLLVFADAHSGIDETITALNGIAALPESLRPPRARLVAVAEKTLAALSTNKDSLNVLVYTLLGLGLPETAQKAADTLAKLAPDDGNLLDSVAEVYFQSGQRDKALEIEARALALKPADKSLLANQERFRTAQPGYTDPSLTDPLVGAVHRKDSLSQVPAQVRARFDTQALLEHPLADHCRALLPGYHDAVGVRIYVKGQKVARVVIQDPEMPKPLRACVEAALKGVAGVADAADRQSFRLRPPANLAAAASH